MRTPDSNASRPDTVTAALLYLMTHYARTGCPKLALCISRHMQCPPPIPTLRLSCATSAPGCTALGSRPREPMPATARCTEA